MKESVTTKCFLILVLLSSCLTTDAAQVQSKKAIVIYADGGRLEVSNWYWGYTERQLNRKNDPFGGSKLKNTTSNKLLLDMGALSERGVRLNDLEISELQLRSIRFSWKRNDTDARFDLEKVTVSLTDGKSIELPALRPSGGRVSLFLMGDTSFNGFRGSFLADLGEKTHPNNSKTLIEEIRYQ